VYNNRVVDGAIVLLNSILSYSFSKTEIHKK